MVLELVTAFSLGILSTSNPCALPLYPGFLAYLARGPRKELKAFLGVSVVAGVISSMLLIGLVLNLLTISIGRLLVFATPVVAGIIALLGILMILDRNPFSRVVVPVQPSFRNPYAKAYVYGLLYGPVSVPCIAPLLFSITATSLLVAETERVLFFVVFGFGLALPLFIIAVLTDAFSKSYVNIITRYHRPLMVVGGLVLLAISAYTFLNLYTFGRYFI